MPQYTNTTTTPGGITVSAVLNTVSNTITVNATTRNGSVGTVTFPANADLADPVISLRGQLRANEVISAAEISSGIRNAVISAVNNVKNQAGTAATVATETNTPVPDAPNPPPEVSAEDNPNLVQPNQQEENNIQNQVNTVNYNNSTTSPAYDDDGNLNPGWAVDELGTVYFAEVEPPLTVPPTTTDPSAIGESVFDPRQEVQENVFDPTGNNGAPQGITTSKSNARSTATNQDAVSFEKAKDWRVRLSLAPSAKYLYKADNPGILKPLQATNGVIFPYTPAVSAVYAANYDASEIIHSNYKIYNYKNSNVDTVTITGDFTAQDTNEANYLLAVIQFFKSVTKMFYGQDQNPRNGTPPPLVYMSGLGTFQFDNHPLAVTNFTYSLPNEVDYIRAGSITNEPGSSTANQSPVNNTDNASTARIQSSGLGPKTPNFQRQQSTINSNATYVPTKMQISITCIPIVTRNDISNNFSLKNYATGALLQGSKRNGGGMW